jgi:beta-lactamase superfamily II metal-dependent hydrolase
MAMSDTIRVRMYNVGFGDCFLLELPGKHTMLVDAGFHSQGKGLFDGNALARQIIEDASVICGQARVDVVIATHRHQDHIYAFNSEAWKELEVGEVWMPWVEERGNTKATRLWKKKERFATALAGALPTFGLDAVETASVKFMLWNAGVAIPEFDAGGWSNAAALDCLHTGFARRDRLRPRFLPDKEPFPETFETPVLPGVLIHVLGPPKDPDFIEKLDPEADGETYRALALRAAAAGSGGAVPLPIDGPFGPLWQIPFPDPLYNPDPKVEPYDGRLLPDEIERVKDLAQSADGVFAAEKVDGMINSTSLVLMLEIGKARLLLPGDAEWGTWKRILESKDAHALLGGATFFKVGHHGSHNATSKTLVEKVLPRQIPAMISTQQGPGNYRNNIPLQELMTALEENQINYVRSDRAGAPLPPGFEQEATQRWIDLTVLC